MKDFKNIYGQDLAIEILTSSISKQHIAPAYLFSGPEGVGKRKTAKVFINAILDRNFDKESTKRKIESNNHPDLLWIEPSYIVQGKSISQTKARSESVSMKSPPQIRLNFTFQNKKWRWIWNLKEKNLKMQMLVEMQCEK